MAIQVKRVNIRGSQAERIAAGDTAVLDQFKVFAQRDADALRCSVELYVCTGPGTGIGHGEPVAVMEPREVAP